MTPHLEAAAPAPFPPALADLLAEAESALSRDLDACRAALAAASALLTPCEAEDMIAGALASWQKRRLVDFVSERLEYSLSLEDLAEVVGLSSSYLCRAFRASFAMSPHAYVVSCRLERARAMMTETSTPLSQIAQACGFADQAHLSRLFSRAYGKPPHRWRLEKRRPA